MRTFSTSRPTPLTVFTFVGSVLHLHFQSHNHKERECEIFNCDTEQTAANEITQLDENDMLFSVIDIGRPSKSRPNLIYHYLAFYFSSKIICVCVCVFYFEFCSMEACIDLRAFVKYHSVQGCRSVQEKPARFWYFVFAAFDWILRPYLPTRFIDHFHPTHSPSLLSLFSPSHLGRNSKRMKAVNLLLLESIVFISSPWLSFVCHSLVL